MSQGGTQCNPRALGMMYWTTTNQVASRYGVIGNMFASISMRNKRMWKGPNVNVLNQTWHNGLSQSIQDRISKDRTACLMGHSPMPQKNDFKCFMPNVVMIDFADQIKCSTIHKLNDVTTKEISERILEQDDYL